VNREADQLEEIDRSAVDYAAMENHHSGVSKVEGDKNGNYVERILTEFNGVTEKQIWNAGGIPKKGQNSDEIDEVFVDVTDHIDR
jgi:hypothetical protein